MMNRIDSHSDSATIAIMPTAAPTTNIRGTVIHAARRREFTSDFVAALLDTAVVVIALTIVVALGSFALSLTTDTVVTQDAENGLVHALRSTNAFLERTGQALMFVGPR